MIFTGGSGKEIRMKAEKKVIGKLNKCYALGMFAYDGKPHIVCAAEKQDPCYAFDLDGTKTDTLWEGPGGVMTVLQAPGDKPVLLATQKFYSPNDSAEAKIVYYTKEDGGWKCSVLCDLPFVHRFGIVEKNGRNWLIACTLKSAHAFKNDWTCPGRIWVAELPENILQYDADHQLKLEPLVSGLYKNHGFAVHQKEDGSTFAVVGTENGIWLCEPPAEEGGEWNCECILEEPASDVLYLDFDGDGERELFVLSPFHGDTVSVYKKKNGSFEKVWERDKKMPFIHAIYSGKINGKTVAFTGNRQEDMELIMISYEDGGYQVTVLDQGSGPANCMFFEDNGVYKLAAANRETDEIALYTLKEE